MQVHGMARMVQTSEKDDGVCVVDLTIRHDALAREATAKGINTLQALVNGHEDKKVFPPSSSASADGAQRLTEDDLKRFTVYVAKSGDISEGAKSAGGIQRTLGEVEVNPRTGYGDLVRHACSQKDLATAEPIIALQFIEIPRLKVWEMIGHAMVIAPLLTDPSQKNGAPKVGEGILAGVIARSAGAWGNDKSTWAGPRLLCRLPDLLLPHGSRVFLLRAEHVGRGAFRQAMRSVSWTLTPVSQNRLNIQGRL